MGLVKFSFVCLVSTDRFLVHDIREHAISDFYTVRVLTLVSRF